MWRKDRFEADVKRVGRSKVAADLFGDKTNTTINSYYGERANMNPSLSTIEMFCRYFARPVSYYVDLSDSPSEEPQELKFLRDIIEQKNELISYQSTLIASLEKEINRLTQTRTSFEKNE